VRLPGKHERQMIMTGLTAKEESGIWSVVVQSIDCEANQTPKKQPVRKKSARRLGEMVGILCGFVG
jgi:hypothetical protein